MQLTWTQAQEITEQAQTEKLNAQSEAIKEYLEASHELTDVADLEYYQQTTGKNIDWLLANGRNLNPLLGQALSMGVTLDELSCLDSSMFY